MRRTPPSTPTAKSKKRAKPQERGAGKPAALDMSLEELKELETKAVRLEKLATMLLNTPQQAFYLYDYSKQEFVLGHEHVSGLYGYKKGEIEKRKDGWFGIVHPDDLAEFNEMRQRMMEVNGSDEVQILRMRVLRKKGGYEWVQTYTRPFERDAQGRVISEAGMAVVITPLVEAEKALQETEARAHSLFQSNAAGVLVFDSKFHITDANPAICRLLGYEKKALLRLAVTDLTAPGCRLDMTRILRQMKDKPKNSAAVDSVLEHKSGGRVDVLAAPACLRDERGAFKQGMLVVLDITGRQKEQAELKREAELNKVMVDHAPVAIGLLDHEGHVLRVNSAAEKLFGFKQREMQGRQVWKLPVFGPGEVGASRERFEALTSGLSKVRATISIRTRSGEIRQVDAETTAVNRPDDSVHYYITTGVDTTEQRKLETEVIRVAEQEHIRIGHDLHDGVGQTLTGIAALVEALAEGLAGSNKQDAQRIHDLVKTAITETRRLSHGLSPAAVKNRGLARGLMLIAETVRENFRRECTCHIEEPMPVVSQESEIHLFRIAQEAINNAIRHGGATKMRISLRRKSTTQGVMEISDNGRGFPAGKAGVQSEGIGLRVMDHRAHLINGNLKIQATKGRGVRVLCQFPLRNP